jgi:curved DNA-binding protein CbpA
METTPKKDFFTKDVFAPRTPRTESFYDVLNVPRDATRTQIREAYIRLQNTFNSQSQVLYSLISDDDAQQMLVKIEEAFRVLNDSASRRQYDIKMGWYGGELTMEFQSADTTPVSVREPFEVGPSDSGYGHHKHSSTLTNLKNISATNVDREDVKKKMTEAIATGEPGDGLLLKKLREIAGVSQDEIQDRTKICLNYIQAIEQNAFERLPNMVFVKGFVRNYLKYLKIQDIEPIVIAFAARFQDWQTAQQTTK